MKKISLPPSRKDSSSAPAPQAAKVDEKKIAAVINKGGSTTKAAVPADIEGDPLKNFNLKILKSELDAINELRDKRPKGRRHTTRSGISLQNWIIEAIHEKITREADVKQV